MFDLDDTKDMPPVREQQKVPLRFIGTWGFWLTGAGLAFVVTMFISAAAGLTLKALPGVSLGVSVAVWFYWQAVHRIAKQRQAKAWQVAVRPDRAGHWVSDKSSGRLSFSLQELPGTDQVENVIKATTRRPVRYFLLWISPAVLLLLAGWILGPRATFSTSATEQVPRRRRGEDGEVLYRTIETTRETDLRFVVILVTTLVAIAWITYWWFRWRYLFYRVTNMNIVILKVPPVWFPFLDDEQLSFPLYAVTGSDIDGGGIKGMLGMEDLVVKTYMQDIDDERLRALNNLSNAREMKEIVDGASYAARESDTAKSQYPRR